MVAVMTAQGCFANWPPWAPLALGVAWLLLLVMCEVISTRRDNARSEEVLRRVDLLGEALKRSTVQGVGHIQTLQGTAHILNPWLEAFNLARTIHGFLRERDYRQLKGKQIVREFNLGFPGRVQEIHANFAEAGASTEQLVPFFHGAKKVRDILGLAETLLKLEGGRTGMATQHRPPSEP